MTKRRRIATGHCNHASVIGNAIARFVIRAHRRSLEVQSRTAKIGQLGRSRRTVDDAPLLASGLELLHVRNAGALLRFITILDEVRDRDSGQNGNDCDHDHDFDEGKTLQHFFHGCVFLGLCFFV